MREYDDIRYRSEWISVDEVNKGWSEDKKFHIKTKDNKNLLLRICDVNKIKIISPAKLKQNLKF